MNKDSLIELKVEKEGEESNFFLNDMKLHHVEKYKIEQSTPPGTAKLTLEILVKYP